MKTTLFIFILCIAYANVAQRNTVYYELLGNGGYSSINYERQLTNSPVLTARLGVGFTSDIVFGNDVCRTLPISGHYLLDIKKITI